jgi:hypothetical protein
VAHVNAVLHGRPPGLVILEALGLEQITEYRRIPSGRRDAGLGDDPRRAVRSILELFNGTYVR